MSRNNLSPSVTSFPLEHDNDAMISWGSATDDLQYTMAASSAEELEPSPAPAAAPPVTVAKTARPASGPALPVALPDAARRIADTHHAEHGTPITAAHLGSRMGVALPVATAALAHL
ncbi:hypothetical protein [Streptomyces olivaceoviridis]|uniref:hypothetical protein n=1 Tax=Streptomyces olivaceoviridis TaxID=1921 RepID=UPI0036F6A66C